MTTQLINTQSVDKTYVCNNDDDNDHKHSKYKCKYVPNDMYYGIGIEYETYLMSDKFIERTGEWLIKNHSRERYSVDYWRNFKEEDVNKALSIIDTNKIYKIPVFINSYTLVKCDKNLQHKTMYTKDGRINPKFNGKSIHELMMEKSEYFKNNMDKEFVYDGDTIEFTTLDFYKTTVDKCVQQLVDYKTTFINEINKVFTENNILTDHYINKLDYSKNFGLVNFITNPNNISICNNSTYHINITLPTKLNNIGKIDNIFKFQKIHTNAIRAIQWIEPMLIACYGSPDIFSVGNNKFSRGSLRIALSRYIGAGTYDTEKVTKGKLLKCFEYDPLLTENDSTILNFEAPFTERYTNQYANKKDHWYKRYHSETGYVAQKSIGFDINYQKHYNHGIEIRFFDSFPAEYLKDVFNILLLTCQSSLSQTIPNPLLSKAYDDQMVECIKNGSSCNIFSKYVKEIKNIFGRKIFKISKNQKISIKENIVEFCQSFVDCIYNKFKDEEFMKHVSPNMQRPVVINYNKIMFDMNKNFLYHGDYYYESDESIDTVKKSKIPIHVPSAIINYFKDHPFSANEENKNDINNNDYINEHNVGCSKSDKSQSCILF